MIIIKYNGRKRSFGAAPMQSTGHILCFSPHPDFPDMLYLQLMMYFQFGPELI